MSEPRRVELNCGLLPGRKTPCLWLEVGSVILPLAYFRGEDEFKAFMALDVRYSPGGGEAAAEALQSRLEGLGGGERGDA